MEELLQLPTNGFATEGYKVVAVVVLSLSAKQRQVTIYGNSQFYDKNKFTNE